MRKALYLLAIIMLAAWAAPSNAGTAEKEAHIANLKNTLAAVKNPKDSIPILYDIFDLSTRTQQKLVGRQLFETALRQKDYATVLDICRLVSNHYTDGTVLQNIIDEVTRLPQSKERDETILFLKMKRLTNDVRYMKEESRQKAIVEILASNDTYQGSPGEDGDQKEMDRKTTSDVHDRLLEVYTLVQYLRNEASGDMLKEYIDKLDDLANDPEVELYSIRNLVNTEAANIYSDAGDYKKSNDASRKLLDVIKGLEEMYALRGRKYRNYDVARYMVYQRMMRNYKDLSPEEIDDIYAKAKELTTTNSDVKHAMENTGRFLAFYYMAKGDYAAAIPKLKDYLAEQRLAPQLRKQLLENLVLAAEKVGDTNTRINALTEYNAILEELNKTNAADKYKELQIKYDVESLRARNANLELENREEEIDASRRLMTFVLVAFILVAVVLVISLMNWSKFKHNASRMGHVVDHIGNERLSLRNSIYYDYADCDDPERHNKNSDQELPSWKTRMQDKGTGHDDVSMFMTETIVNDLIYIASFGRDARRKYVQEYSVDALMRKIQHRTNEACKGLGTLRVEATEDDFTIVTDGECLVDILSHILTGAVKASPAHASELAVEKTNHGKVNFLITISGMPGASPGDPHVFEGFISDHNIMERKNSGLFICRMISLLLKTTHYPDTSYKAGARYVFSLPDNMNDILS